MDDNVRETIFEAIEASLEAQLNAVRKLRKRQVLAPKTPNKGKSQVVMVFDVLTEAKRPLHLKDILSSVEARFGVRLDADSLVSALTKYVVKGERFTRPAKNTFGILEDENAG